MERSSSKGLPTSGESICLSACHSLSNNVTLDMKLIWLLYPSISSYLPSLLSPFPPPPPSPLTILPSPLTILPPPLFLLPFPIPLHFLPSSLPLHLLPTPTTHPHQGTVGSTSLSSHHSAVLPGGVVALPRTV